MRGTSKTGPGSGSATPEIPPCTGPASRIPSRRGNLFHSVSSGKVYPEPHDIQPGDSDRDVPNPREGIVVGTRGSKSVRLTASLGVLFVLTLVAGQPAAAKVGPGSATFDYGTPVFGIATAPDGGLLVADYGAGIVELRKGAGTLIAELPGITDIAPIGRGSMFAITGGGGANMPWALYRVSRGGIQMIANLSAFENTTNPDGGADDSNPFEVVALSEDTALVADAGGNDLLVIDQD